MNELEILEAEVTAMKDADATRKATARAVLAATEGRLAEARKFLAENESLLPYRLAAAVVGDPDWTVERATAFRRELDEARDTVVEGALLAKGLTELIEKDWLGYTRLVKAIQRRDQFKRRAEAQAA